jgi:hypothetical protein
MISRATASALRNVSLSILGPPAIWYVVSGSLVLHDPPRLPLALFEPMERLPRFKLAAMLHPAKVCRVTRVRRQPHRVVNDHFGLPATVRESRFASADGSAITECPQPEHFHTATITPCPSTIV